MTKYDPPPPPSPPKMRIVRDSPGTVSWAIAAVIVIMLVVWSA